jgi:histidinol dehydrogenase
MSNDDYSLISEVEVVINVLTQAKQFLNEHDYASAQVLVSLSRQVLEDLQPDFERHLQIEATLKQLLTRSS